MAFGESISGYSSLDCTLRVPELSLKTFDMLIMLVDYFGWGFWYSQFLHASLIYLYEIFDMLIMRLIILIEDFVFFFFFFFISMFVEYTNMLIILIDHLALLSIVILFFSMIILIALHV